VKALAAVWTGVGAGVAVDEEVGGEGRGAFEALPTLRARERLLLIVHHAMLGCNADRKKHVYVAMHMEILILITCNV
jgi:hypothetical protein